MGTSAAYYIIQRGFKIDYVCYVKISATVRMADKRAITAYRPAVSLERTGRSNGAMDGAVVLREGAFRSVW